MSVNSVEKIRNIAIIAHVDHGKTTLVDQIFKSTIGLKASEESQERLMDSGAVEQKRGITIMAKCTSVHWKGHKINILDTPGHADFGAEVQRVLKIADMVVVLVDAVEGIKPQTRFVLKNALALKLPGLIFVNKIDRVDKDQRESHMVKAAHSVLDYMFEQTDDMNTLETKVFYGSGRSGYASSDKTKAVNQTVDNIDEFLDTIISDFKHPMIQEEPGRFLTTMIAPNDHKGRLLIGRVYGNGFKIGDKCFSKKYGSDEIEETLSIKEIVEFRGLEQIFVKQAIGGDIVGIYTGCSETTVGYSLISTTNQSALETPKIDAPVLSVIIGVNSLNPGKHGGKYVTFSAICKRLVNESESNVGIRVKKNSNSLQLSCRGALQMGILLEALRQEGYEFQVSAAQIETITGEDGIKREPIEDICIDINQDFINVVMNSLQQRSATIQNTTQDNNNNVTIHARISSRNLLGYTTEFNNQTKGTGILNREIIDYQPVSTVSKRDRGFGRLIASESGVANAYAMNKRIQKGNFFVKPGDSIHKGQIIGEAKIVDDLHLNITQGKKLTNMRSSGKDEKAKIPHVKPMQIEQSVTYIMNDERIHVTPNGTFIMAN